MGDIGVEVEEKEEWWKREGVCNVCFFFFKQKTAYEMCGRDWSSDVCSSDLGERGRERERESRGLT